jgi:lipid-A-disaccharide synthase-like uncharacterized protein
MNDALFHIQMFGHTCTITIWKLIGYTGVLLFAGRWLVQVIASHRVRRSHLPLLFWYMSLSGSALLLSYFTFSEKNDSVGILSNLFPATIAAYNLFLEKRRFRADVNPHSPHPAGS